MRVALVLVSSLVLLGCDAARKDLETICNVRARAKVPADASAEKAESMISEYLMLNVHSSKVKKTFATMGSKSPAEKAKLLRREATSEGLTSCPLADEFDPPAVKP
jgi:hypothetical protein